MKKNVLKVLLLFVVVALMFALVACGGSKDSGKKSDNNNKKDDKQQEQTNTDTQTNAQKLEKSITDIIKTVGPILNTVSSIKADSTVNVDVGLGGYVSGKYNHGFDITAKAVANGTNPAVALGVKYDDKDYFGLGYKDGVAYLLEGLNMINTDNKTAAKVKADVAYLKDGINHAAGEGMKFLADATSGFSLDLEAEILPLLTGKNADGTSGGMGGMNLFEMLGDLLTVTETADKTTIELTKEKVFQTGAERKNSVIGILESLKNLGIDLDFAAIEDTITDVIQNYVSKVIKQLEGYTFEDLLTNYEPSLKIIAGYTGSGENKALNRISIAIALNKTLELELGINIDLNNFSLTNATNVSFSGYQNRSLETSVMALLGEKELYGELTGAINLATAFAAKDNVIAKASLAVGNGDKSGVATCTYDGRYVLMNAEDFCTGLEIETTGAKKFYNDFGITSGENKIGLQEFLKTQLNELTYKKSSGGNETPANNDENNNNDDEDETGLLVSVYNFVGGLFLKEGEAETVWSGNDDPTVDDIAKLGFKKLNPYVKNFITFPIVDAQGNGLSYTTVFDSIKTIYARNEEVLKDSVYAEAPEAGAHIWGNNNKNLLKFAGAFVKIPALKGNDEDGYTINLEEDENGVIKNTVDGSALDDTFVKHYIEALFALDDEVADESYADWNAEMKEVFGIGEKGFETSIVNKILGISYAGVVENGVTAFARYEEGNGLEGYIGLKSNKDEEDIKIYAELGASIGWSSEEMEAIASGDDIATFIAAAELFTQTNEGETEMNDDLWSLILNTTSKFFAA